MKLLDPDDPPPSLDMQCFGDELHRSRIVITDARGTVEQADIQRRHYVRIDPTTGSAESNSLVWDDVLTQPTRLSGRLQIWSPQKTLEELFALAALSRIHTLGGGYCWHNCSVSFDATEFQTEGLYKLSLGLDAIGVLRTAAWLTSLRGAILEFWRDKWDRLLQLSPRGFERLVAEILRANGWRVELTPQTRDGGYDLLAICPGPNGSNETVLIECKRYKYSRNVGVDVVRKVIGVCQIENATRGVIVTTADFTKPAKDAVLTQSSRINICNGSMLAGWLSQFQRR